jgi:hypothetical protein
VLVLQAQQALAVVVEVVVVVVAPALLRAATEASQLASLPEAAVAASRLEAMEVVNLPVATAAASHLEEAAESLLADLARSQPVERAEAVVAVEATAAEASPLLPLALPPYLPVQVLGWR